MKSSENYAQSLSALCIVYHEKQENIVIEFIETLKSDSNVSAWQIRQAGDAIRLYYFHYRGFKPNNLLAGKSDDFTPELLAEAKRLVRLKHYSYSTEKTYLQGRLSVPADSVSSAEFDRSPRGARGE